MYCRGTILNLRRQLDTDGALLVKLKTEKQDCQSSIQALQSNIRSLTESLKAAENKYQTYKVLNTELTHKLEGTVQHITHAYEQQQRSQRFSPGGSNTPMLTEFNEIVNTRNKSPNKKN